MTRTERICTAVWWLFLCLASQCSDSSAAGAAKLEIVVPAYFYPSAGSDWNDLNAAAGKVPITAIMNPFNGPGSSLDANYVSAVNSLRAAGGRVIGYVYTGYTSRPLQQVLNDINRYDMWYNVDGIFVDEMANTGPAERLNYYREIYNYVKSIDANWEVMGNPGTTTLEQYLTWPTADPGYTPSSWNLNYDRSKFVHLVHTEMSSANMLTDLNLAVQRNAGGIYVTDDVLPNPWDRLPNFWTSLVNAVAAINADYNGNGVVDAADYAIWRKSIGQTGVSLAADGNIDNFIDDGDYDVWRAHFGETAVTGSRETTTFHGAIPEPTGIILCLIAAMVAAIWVRGGLQLSAKRSL
jgi:Spherulation-specific family 4